MNVVVEASTPNISAVNRLKYAKAEVRAGHGIKRGLCLHRHLRRSISSALRTVDRNRSHSGDLPGVSVSLKRSPTAAAVEI
jgi:hypothetical protein